MAKKSKLNPAKAAAAALNAAAAPPTIKNCAWSNNNAACVNTWFCLSAQTLGQFDSSFDDAETLQMRELAYWNDLASPDNREIEAAIWHRHREEYARAAEQAITMPQCLAAFRSPAMNWSIPA